MDMMQAILERKSYRGKYTAQPVPREHLQAIMEAGLAAPSGCNKQTTSLIAVDDPQVLEKLHSVITPSVGETAPAMICVLTERIIAYRDRCFATQDYSAAIENMLLAITALGYESCWVEGYVTRYPEVAAAMAAAVSAPDGYSVVAYLPVGKPAEEYRYVQKKAFEERAAFNSFDGGNK